jgi:hypothetical protein
LVSRYRFRAKGCVLFVVSGNVLRNELETQDHGAPVFVASGNNSATGACLRELNAQIGQAGALRHAGAECREPPTR